MMEQRDWVEVLDRHADGLNEGTDLSAPLLAVARLEDRPALEALLDTARRVRAALAGQPRHAPRPAFTAQLKAQLLAGQPGAAGTRHLPNRRTWLWWAAGAGGVVSAAGLGYLAYRALGGGISGIMAARTARPALSDAQPAP